MAFHPKASMLATLSKRDSVIDIWNVDRENLLSASPIISSMYYANAKVVLLGDTGVGKSGLNLVLTNRPFVPTDSTHARHIGTFDSQIVDLADGRKEIHEMILWDLAGQPGYRLIHQLHLNKVSSSDLFQRIKDFIVAEKDTDQILLTSNNLYSVFLNFEKITVETEGLRSQFGTCIGRVEARGLIQRLSFGDFVLLQPELLDSYASALITDLHVEN